MAPNGTITMKSKHETQYVDKIYKQWPIDLIKLLLFWCFWVVQIHCTLYNFLNHSRFRDKMNYLINDIQYIILVRVFAERICSRQDPPT